MKVVAAGLTLVLSLVFFLSSPEAGEKKPKYSIPEVMQLAHKKGLLLKVVTGKASQKEKEQLAEMYVALSENEPPQGEIKDWKKKTAEIVRLAKAAAKGDPGAPKLLKKAANCAACHKIFKG